MVLRHRQANSRAEASASGRLETGRTMWWVAKTSCSSPLSSSSEHSDRVVAETLPLCHAPGAPMARNRSIRLAVWSSSAGAESAQKVPLRRARFG